MGEDVSGNARRSTTCQASPHAARTARQDDRPPVQNDAGNSHLPLQVENNIEELGKCLSLMQPGDVAQAHEL